jgi:hypothetical protein
VLHIDSRQTFQFRSNNALTFLDINWKMLFIASASEGESISIKWMFVYMRVCVCVYPGITLERLERFQLNLVHTLLYVCVRILYMFYTYSAGRMVWEAGNLDDSHC